MPLHTFRWFFPFFYGLFFGVAAMTLHEIAHLLVAFAVGVKIKSVGFCWRGLYTVREAGTPRKNLIVTLAGPLMNFALLILWPLSPMFGLANLCLGFFNLIPLTGSDGDRALGLWYAIKHEKIAPVERPRAIVYRYPQETIRGVTLTVGSPQAGD
jgi:Zn-dependent protease